MTLAVIDADILVYECAFRAQHTANFGDGEYFHTARLEEAVVDFEHMIEETANEVKAARVLLALTNGDESYTFRRTWWDEYKRHRRPHEKPLLYAPLREWVYENYTVKTKPGIEADDVLGIMGTQRPGRVMCSVDKDLLTVPGQHYNWRKMDKGIVHVSEEAANLTHLRQTLTGDSTDNYPGCPGIGVKRAQAANTWADVVSMFEAKGLNEQDALAQAICARILRAEDWDFENERPIPWAPPKEEE